LSRQFLSDFGPPPGEGPKRRATDGLARHGVAGPVGQVPNGARYGRILGEPDRQEWDVAELEELASALAELGGKSTDNFDIPSGYTYFGQFVDHDSTFDPTSRLRRANDPAALVDYRSPALDLDSLYGSGPMDQPYMYDWDASPAGVKLLLGHGRAKGRRATSDLPRNAQGRALIGDPRNDENLIVSQLHQLMIRFHNRVVDELTRSIADPAELFAEAQRRVRWHYQWIVAEDFLPLIVGTDTAAAVYRRRDGQRPDITRRFYRCTKRPFMPVEFSGAAYRFGHSMVREDYKLNDATPNAPLFAARRGDHGRRLAGNRPLPRELVIEWKHFLPTTDKRPQASKLIDPSLAKALLALPPDKALLPRLNLLRGHALQLPSGQSAAARIGVAPLTGEELLSTLPALSPALENKVRRATPLWLYVLAEAKVRAGGGRHLGPAGGRIVAEVLAGMLAADPSSFVNAERPWKPEYATTLTELARFAGDATP
jgi:Animal haem peroxidase